MGHAIYEGRGNDGIQRAKGKTLNEKFDPDIGLQDKYLTNYYKENKSRFEGKDIDDALKPENSNYTQFKLNFSRAVQNQKSVHTLKTTKNAIEEKRSKQDLSN